VSTAVVAIPGARRPETARSAASAATLDLDRGERVALRRAFGAPRAARIERPRPLDDAEVVVVMGIPGAGKSRIADEYVARGYVRLNRDERGGSLRKLAEALEHELAAGTRRVVLDNTYLTRAGRSYVIDAANRHRLPARCVWADTPLAQAQVNLVQRLLERLGALPTPQELRALTRREPGVLAPTSQMRALRELEPPSTDEGWATIEHAPFSRAASDHTAAGVFVAAAAATRAGWKEAVAQGNAKAPHLAFDWSPVGNREALTFAAGRLAAEVAGPVEAALCPHPAGPPTCWCRPPLPGLLLAFGRAHRVDPSRSILVGVGAAHRTLATTLGARYIQI